MNKTLFDLQDEKNSLEINKYIKAKKSFATNLALGVALIIISHALWGLVKDINIFIIIPLYLIIIAIGVLKIVFAGIRFNPYRKIIKQQYTIEDDDYEKLVSCKNKAKTQFFLFLFIGVLLCIIALIIPIYAFFIANGLIIITIIFILLAIATFLFIYSSIILNLYSTLIRG